MLTNNIQNKIFSHILDDFLDFYDIYPNKSYLLKRLKIKKFKDIFDITEPKKFYVMENIMGINNYNNYENYIRDNYTKTQPSKYDLIPVIAYNLNGSVYKEYKSISEACLELNGEKSLIKRSILSNLYLHKGYKWKLVNNSDLKLLKKGDNQ